MPGVYADVVPADMQETPGDAGVSRSQEPAAVKAPAPADPFTGKGELLEEQDDKVVFEAVHRIVKGQEPLAKNRAEKDKHWSRVRRGVPFSEIKKDEDRASWKAELPPGIDDKAQPIPNKADDLCRKMAAQIMVDPPIADPKPATDSDEDRGAADAAKKFLKGDGDESGTNDTEAFRASADLEMTKASAFLHVWVDATGGGWRPKQLKARPDAPDAQNALMGSGDFALRYVTDGGQFTENPADAARQWLPKHQRDILIHAHVRTVPETADVHRAEAVILVMVAPLGEAKRRFPALQDLDDAQLLQLCEWRPLRPKAVVPPAFRSRLAQQDRDKGKAVTDDTLIFWYQKYCKVGPSYVEGADIAVNGAGGGYVIQKATLRDDIPLERGGFRPLLRDIPVAQIKCLHDSEEGDPFGRPAIELFGGANETYAHLYGAILEHLDILLHPNLFIAALSPVQAWQLNARDGRPINVASKEDMPTYEDVNPLPTFTPQILEMLEQDMQQAAQLGDTAAGLDVATSQSGVAKQTVVAQAKVHLASIAQNFFTGVKRYWRIKLQLAQAKLTVPQQVEYVGTDSSHKQRWFTGADFGGVKDVAIMAGSGTMMGATEKQQYVAMAQGQGWMDPDEGAETGRSLLGDDLGLKPNPHLELISRQLAEWSEGPQQQAAPQVDPATGQPTPSASPFVPRPTDEDPNVAKTRYRKLRDFMATSDYSKWPPEWRMHVDNEYTRMAYAAGVQTMRQQAEAQAQQAAQQQASQQQDRAAQGEQANQDRQFKAEQNQANRDAQMARTQLQTTARAA